MVLSLDKLNNTNNLEDGRLSNTLLTFQHEEFMHFKPVAPQYKRLKNREFASLTLRIMDQKNNVMTEGLEVTVVFHV